MPRQDPDKFRQDSRRSRFTSVGVDDKSYGENATLAKQLLGSDTFKRPPTEKVLIGPKMSNEGDEAVRDLTEGSNPGEIVSKFRGGPKGDIDLPPDPARKRSIAGATSRAYAKRSMKGRR